MKTKIASTDWLIASAALLVPLSILWLAKSTRAANQQHGDEMAARELRTFAVATNMSEKEYAIRRAQLAR